MKPFRACCLVLFPLWIAACATAEDASPDLGGVAGTTQSSPAGATGSAGSHGSAAGAGGTLGSAGSGSGGRAGSTGHAGDGTGAGGSTGSAGSGGGGGGSAPVFEPGACAVNPTISLQYLQGSTQQAQITAQYQFINTSDTPIPIGALTIRYFFTNEETSIWKLSIYNAQLDGGTGGYRRIDGATLKVVPLTTKLEGADTYTQLAFPAGISLEKGATAKVNWDMQPTSYDPPAQVQTNDYSYNAADTTFTVWDHIAVYQDGTLVWGCAPKAPGDGSAGESGAGGDTGTAGDSGAQAGAAGASGESSAGAGGAP